MPAAHRVNLELQDSDAICLGRLWTLKSPVDTASSVAYLEALPVKATGRADTWSLRANNDATQYAVLTEISGLDCQRLEAELKGSHGC